MEWRKVNGFSRYSVSLDGQVKNDETGLILSASEVTGGYLSVMTGESVELGTVPIRAPDAPNELIPREQLEGMYERPAYRYDFYNECGFWVIIGPMGVERFIFLTSLDEVEGPYDLTDYGVRWGLFPREVDPETVNWEDT